MVWCGYRAQEPGLGCTLKEQETSSTGVQRGDMSDGAHYQINRLLPPMGLES